MLSSSVKNGFRTELEKGVLILPKRFHKTLLRGHNHAEIYHFSLISKTSKVQILLFHLHILQLFLPGVLVQGNFLKEKLHSFEIEKLSVKSFL